MTTRTEGEEILATYHLTVVGPGSVGMPWYQFVPDMTSALRETEENLTDLLPTGYRVVIWEAPKPRRQT